MEGLRDSKLGEGQQWGKNSSSKDKVDWGRRPTYIGTPESNRYAHSPHRAVLPLQGAVLPLGRLWPFETQQRSGERQIESQSGTTAGGSGSTTGGAVLPLPPTVLPLRLRAEGRREEEARAVLAAVVATVLPLISGTTACYYRCYYRESRHEDCSLESTRQQRTTRPVVPPGQQAVLPLQQRYCRLWPIGCTTARAAVLPLASESQLLKTETAITSANELQIEQTQACWIDDDMGYPNSDWLY
jgi:hypothetical protein